MVRPKSYDVVFRELVEHKKWEKANAKKFSEQKCKHCKGSMQALGKSNVEGVCGICANIALIPAEE
jgi:hypothetical protein